MLKYYYQLSNIWRRIIGKVVIKQSSLNQLANDIDGPIAKDLQRRADNVLQKAKELVPRASGDFANSLRKVVTTQRGRVVVRIVSNDPQVNEIRFGTVGPYGHEFANVSRLRSWAVHRGIDSSPKNIFRLARGIAIHGTAPAGTYGTDLTVEQALREAVKKAQI